MHVDQNTVYTIREGNSWKGSTFIVYTKDKTKRSLNDQIAHEAESALSELFHAPHAPQHA